MRCEKRIPMEQLINTEVVDCVKKNKYVIIFYCLASILFKCLPCFDTVGWAAGRASGL